jgi:hypothetical protein
MMHYEVLFMKLEQQEVCAPGKYFQVNQIKD